MSNTRIIKVHRDFDFLVREMKKEMRSKTGRKTATIVNVTRLIASNYRKKYKHGKWL